MILLVAVRKVKSVLLLILHLLRRCFCCLKRRKFSSSQLPITISADGSIQVSSTSGNQQGEEGFENWDSWDVPSSVVSEGGGRAALSPQQSALQQHINQYRLNQQRKMQEPEQEPIEPDYFQDLTPSIEAKPQVLILERPEEEQQVSNRLSFTMTEPLLQSTELEDWMEDCDGWEGEAEGDDFDAVLREKRHYERERRREEHLRRKAEKEAARASRVSASKIATKLS